MRALRYSINVTLDGCCDHRAIAADEELHRHAIENLDRADALLFGWNPSPGRSIAAIEAARRGPLIDRTR